MATRMRLLAILICFGLAINWNAQAAPAPDKNAMASPLAASDEPVEVTADESLEWRQDERLYIARGKARATRGTTVVEADVLTAHERETATSDEPGLTADRAAGNNIDRLTAEGNVLIRNNEQEIHGDYAVYDLDRHFAKITGKNLKYVTSRDVVTAKESMEYYDDKNMAVARGKAVALHDERHVEADILTARFVQKPNGEMEMSDMTAEGHVAVIAGDDVVRGDKAVYDVKRNVAVITGNVRITRDDTHLSGARAEVDFTQGRSRLLNDGKGRVRALLTPKASADKNANALPAKDNTPGVDRRKPKDQKAIQKVPLP